MCDLFSCLEVAQFRIGKDLQLYDCFFANIADWETKKYTGHCCLKTQWISVGRSYSEQIKPKYLWWFSLIRSNSLMNNIILSKEAAVDQYVASSWKVKTKASWVFFSPIGLRASPGVYFSVRQFLSITRHHRHHAIKRR